MNKDSRICYFGTRGKPGHLAYPIVGNFKAEELADIAKIDSSDIYEEMVIDGFVYGRLGSFMYYAIPYSVDDKRPGSFSALFVEFATSSRDIREVILSDLELRWRFSERIPKVDEVLNILLWKK